MLNCNLNNNKLLFHTSKGTFEVKLFVNSHPLTSANFISNVNKKLYDKSHFYKILNYQNTKIIYGGINSNEDLNGINEGSFYSNNKIPLEIKLINNKIIYGIPIYDPPDIKKLKYKFEKGSLAMVKINNENSSSTEFFITLNDLPEFNGRYSVFGRVIKGIEVLENINKNDLIKSIDYSYLDGIKSSK